MLPPIASFLSRILVVASVLIALVGLFVISGNALERGVPPTGLQPPELAAFFQRWWPVVRTHTDTDRYRVESLLSVLWQVRARRVAARGLLLCFGLEYSMGWRRQVVPPFVVRRIMPPTPTATQVLGLRQATRCRA